MSEREQIERLTRERDEAIQREDALRRELAYAVDMGNQALVAHNKSEAGCVEMRDALVSIRIYGNDTLSGRVDGGPDDRNWQRDAVLEMTKRAVAALSGDCGKGWVRAEELYPTTEVLSRYANNGNDAARELARLETLIKQSNQ